MGKGWCNRWPGARPLTVIEVNSTPQAIGWSLDPSAQTGFRPCHAAACADAIISHKIFRR